MPKSKLLDKVIKTRIIEINIPALQNGYSWPIALHNIPGGTHGEPGVGLNEKLQAVVDGGWKVNDWFLDFDSSNNYLNVQSAGQRNKNYFSCTPRNF